MKARARVNATDADAWCARSMYALTQLPDFLKGLQGIKTACDDKHSDPNDLEFLCFDLNQRAAVYILYDKRAHDRPTWLKSEFTNQHIAVVDDNTDVNLGGLYEIYYKIFSPGQVCIGGNDAPGVGANYLVMAGPMVDLTLAPTHRVEITGLVTHSTGTPGNPLGSGGYWPSTLNPPGYHWTPPVAEATSVGDSYYVDQTSFKLGTLPSFLHSLVGIRTNNGDKFQDAGDEEFICFTVDEPVRVYLLYDPRIVHSPVGLPAWVAENFVDRHEETARSGTANDQRAANEADRQGSNADSGSEYPELLQQQLLHSSRRCSPVCALVYCAY
jgi:hypothetical protein